ncbi:MAG TPA: 6-phosphogluconolactonase [Rubrobacteraceae bacterium]|nr:6-phosphogluconolactonase [Rubrobacteraceae bacterium]
MNLKTYKDKQELAEAAARDFVERAQKAIEDTDRFVVALAGGSTPEATYEMLATEEYADRLDWSKVHVFFGDERSVPPDDEDSNYRMANEALLSHVPVGSVHRMKGELHPDEAAAEYEEELREFFGTPGRPPEFDLIQLGIGDDGHTASLFPNTPALDVTDCWVAQNPVPKLETVRITLTLPVLNAAKAISFLIAGEGKAEALREVLEGDADPYDYPSKFVQPVGELNWMADQEAASMLDQT